MFELAMTLSLYDFGKALAGTIQLTEVSK